MNALWRNHVESPEEPPAAKEEEELQELPQDVAVVDDQEEECYILMCEGKPVGKCNTCSVVVCERHAKWSQDRLHMACSVAHLPPPASLPHQAPQPSPLASVSTPAR